MIRAFVPLVAIAVPMTAFADVNLSQYQLAGRFALPSPAGEEASAVTYNWETDSLFVLGDEGESIVEINRQGVQLSVMSLTGFDDTEGLTFLGGGRFALAEERIQDIFELTYTAGGTLDRAGLRSASLGPTVGNVGIEGISYDPRDGSFVAVKEKTPTQVLRATIDFAAGAANVADLFVPNLGVLDLADVQVLSTVPSLLGTPDADNLLLYSQESSLLLEVTRSGQILSQFDFSALADNAEGVTIDSNGVIYIVGENPELYVLAPIPTPGSVVLLAGAALCAVSRRRR